MPRAPLLAIDALRPSPRKVAQVVDVLRQGGVVAYPTDTVYGLGCGLTQRKAIDRIYRIKGLDRGHLLSFICADLSNVSRYAVVNDSAYRWLRKLLPGPYTIILEATREVPRLLVEKRRTVGIRIPAHPLCQALVRELGEPLISTSAAGPDGEVLLDGHDIQERLGTQVDLIVESGAADAIPSTVLSLLNDRMDVIREGKGPVDGVVR